MEDCTKDWELEYKKLQKTLAETLLELNELKEILKTIVNLYTSK